MSTSTDPSNVTVVTGDLLQSSQQTLVNTVNTVGVMGKGIALAFRRRYPTMFDDYVQRCERGEVVLGQPYVFDTGDRLIVNFPTKSHWRAVSRLEDIVHGLEFLEEHYEEWGITSLAVPPLGCGNGQLEWAVVGPTLVKHLSRLRVPVELYAPNDATDSSSQGALFELGTSPEAPRVPPEWIGVVAVLDRLQRQPYHWPVGRVMFQKLAYFATEAGLSTGLTFSRGPYGPFSAELNRRVAQLQNNGLAIERPHDSMIEVRVGPTYSDAVEQSRERIEPYRDAIERTVDLMARMSTRSAEIAATAHFVIAEHASRNGVTPTLSTVMEEIEAWKPGRFRETEIVEAVGSLCMRGWSTVEIDDHLTDVVEQLVTA